MGLTVLWHASLCAVRSAVLGKCTVAVVQFNRVAVPRGAGGVVLHGVIPNCRCLYCGLVIVIMSRNLNRHAAAWHV